MFWEKCFGSRLDGPNSIGKWFRTGYGKDVICHPPSFNIYIEQMMSDALEEQDRTVIISSRNIINLQFGEGIDAIADEEQEHETLVKSLNKTCTRYKMEISA